MNTFQQPKKKSSIFKKALIGVGVVFGFFLLLGIVGMIFFPPDYYKDGLDAYNKRNYEKAFDNLNKVKPDDKNYKDAIAKIQEIKPIVDSLEKVKKEEKSKASTATASMTDPSDNTENDGMDLKTKIENNIKSLDGGDDLTKNQMTSAAEFQITAALFGAYAITINEGSKSTDKEVLKLTEQLKKKVIASQQKNFPKLRKAYYEFIREKLWENDVDVNLSGNGNTTIKFTGGYFASNKNIKSTQETLHEMLTLLRFKQTQYRWYKGQDEYTYYTIESPKDNEVVQ